MNQHIGTINKIVYGVIFLMVLLLIQHYFFNDETYDEAQAHYERGRELEDDFLEEEAETHFSAAIELRPRFAVAYAWRCDVRYVIGKFDEALEDCNRALELDRSLTSVYTDRCLVYSELGDFERAEQDCNRALIHDPDSTTTHNMLGLLNTAMGDEETAIEHFNTAIEIDNLDSVLYYNRGRAYVRLDKYDIAVEDFQISVNLAENHYNAHLYLVSMLYELSRYDDAQDAADYMIINFPDEAESYVWRASIYIQLEDYSAALGDLSYAIELDRTYPYIYSNLGLMYSRQNKTEESVKAYCDYIPLVDEAEEWIMEWVEDNGGCSE